MPVTTSADPRQARSVLRASGLTRTFGSGKNLVTAVDHVGFNFHDGEIASIVGESGSGKTTLMRMLMGLIKPTEGNIFFNDEPVHIKTTAQRRAYWQQVQAIFQDPFASFNQFFRISKMFEDCAQFSGRVFSKEEKHQAFVDACNFVNLKYEELENKYPFELSGGQMQRMMIARIFLLEPKVLIADEPTSMIDACSRSTILEMLLRLRERNQMTIIFITHDLGLAYYISNTLYIMEKGRFVESGDASSIVHDPQSPYTRHLLSDVPKLNEEWILSEG